MNPSETAERIRSRVWKAVAQGEVDVSGLDKETLEQLVELITEAALLEMDGEFEQVRSAAMSIETAVAGDILNDEKEDILWEGRPFLSLVEDYTITDERIRITRGMLGKDRENVELVRVQDMDYSQSLGERMFKLGDITIRSHDPSHPLVVLRNVRDPEAIYELLRRAVLNARKKHGLIYREEM